MMALSILTRDSMKLVEQPLMKKVMVRYQADYSTVYIEWDEQLVPISIVDKVHNGHAKRERIRMTEDR
ncbi:hypothetical protein KCA1_1476 [Lactiplantibacillus pentosus KCA1]|nr:hypothetical protein [Lactiplantibacillus pentosus]EIW13997.1 hypothetical protein KCA1_1476 [Lactiplantibacillus pentosus KCA1]